MVEMAILSRRADYRNLPLTRIYLPTPRQAVGLVHTRAASVKYNLISTFH